MIALLDTGAVSWLGGGGAEHRDRLRVLRRRMDSIVVPAAVLAEGLFSGHVGRDHHVHRFLSEVQVSAVDEALGRAAGALRQGVIRSRPRHGPSGVDAIVAATADRRAAREQVTLFTADPRDLDALLRGAPNAGSISIVGV